MGVAGPWGDAWGSGCTCLHVRPGLVVLPERVAGVRVFRCLIVCCGGAVGGKEPGGSCSVPAEGAWLCPRCHGLGVRTRLPSPSKRVPLGREA